MNKPAHTSEDSALKMKEYKKLRALFDQKDETGFTSIHELGIEYKDTEVGTFLPAETTIIYTLFQDLLSNGFLDPTLPLLDAGSGDARVNHMAALSGVTNSIGIEYSLEIIEKSRKQTKAFEDAQIIKKGSVTLLHGDFTKVETYTKNGLTIESIKTFFNYINGWKELVAFIDTHSPRGVTLILIDEQYTTSNRILEEVSTYTSIALQEIRKYIYYKDTDTAEILTPELFKTIQESDSSIASQHIHLDISSSGEYHMAESPYRVVTVYLFEKIS